MPSEPYRECAPDFAERLEVLVRAGKTINECTDALGYVIDSPLFFLHLRQTWPGCEGITDLRAMWDLPTAHFQPRVTARLVAKVQQDNEVRDKAIASFRPLFEKHTCLMPVGWQAIKPGTQFIRTWYTSIEARAARAACPECQAGRLLPFFASKDYKQEAGLVGTTYNEPEGNVAVPAKPKPVKVYKPREPKPPGSPKPQRDPMRPRVAGRFVGRPIKEGTLRWKRAQPRQLCKNECGKMSELYGPTCTGEYCSRACMQDYKNNRKHLPVDQRPKPKVFAKLQPASERPGSWRWKRRQPRQLCVNQCGNMSTLYSTGCSGDFCSAQCARLYTSRSTAERRSQTLLKKHEAKQQSVPRLLITEEIQVETVEPQYQRGMPYDQNDIHSLALCAWKEARGESQPQGCDAVMYIIVNRVGAPGFAPDLHGVIYGKNQFTSMSVPSDPEFNLQPKEDDATFLACMDSANSILSNVDNPDRVDITKGAHFYANLHNVTSGWFHDNIVCSSLHPITAQIGRHTFFL